MNIGIVTFWSSEDNYGEVLQAVALYKYLESRGHRCFIVKYSEERNSSFVSRLFTLIGLMGNPAKLVARIRRSCRQSDPLLNRRSRRAVSRSSATVGCDSPKSIRTPS